MTIVDRWLLPDGVEELLPEQAAQAETLRRRLLDLYHSWGYDLVVPPLLEYTESLLVGLGSDIDLLTFRVTDQMTGRTMGVRADITPQVARIDAHSLQRDGAVRLCYAGSVLHTKPQSMMASRSPIQVGAELYGDSGSDSDVEVISLMLETLNVCGISGVTLDLGHVGIYGTLVEQAGLSAEQEKDLFDALQRKAVAEIDLVLADVENSQAAEFLRKLVDLHGDISILDQAEQQLAGASEAVADALKLLRDIAGRVSARMPEVTLYFDLAELRGYHYHTGVVFAAFAEGCGRALANGGRYDHIGEVFGRARPATGFNTDLKTLITLFSDDPVSAGAIYAPAGDQAGLWDAVQKLRGQGERVVCGLDSQGIPEECDRELRLENGAWSVVSLGV